MMIGWTPIQTSRETVSSQLEYENAKLNGEVGGDGDEGLENDCLSLNLRSIAFFKSIGPECRIVADRTKVSSFVGRPRSP